MEVLLTEVKVRKHKLFHHFDGLGGCYRDFDVVYHTKVLGRKGEGSQHVQEVLESVANNPSLKKYPAYKFEKPSGQTHFDVVQLIAPPGVNEIIRKEGHWKHDDEVFIDRKLPPEFMTGHYTDQARHSPCPPWRFGVLDEGIIALLNERNVVQESIRGLERRVDDEFADKPQATRTRLKREAFEQTQKPLGSQKLPSSIIAHATDVHHALDALKAHAHERKANINYVLPAERDGFNGELLELHLPKGDYFHPTRLITPHELHQLPWLVFDTESPFFQEKDQTVTWIPYATVLEGAVTERVVMTTNDLGTDVLEGYRVVSFADKNKTLRENAERMTQVFADVVRKHQVICAYNASYDLPTLRDMGDFEVGNRHTEPKKEVTLKFFERIGVAGKLVLDPMRIARMACSHLVNAKADNVLPYLTGGKPFKELDHSDLGQLEHLALGHEVQKQRENVRHQLERRSDIANVGHRAGRIIGSYAVGDVENLVNAVLTEFLYKKALHAAYHVAERFGTDYGRVLHLPSAVNEGQERCYFENVGVMRDTIYLPTTTQKRRETQARHRVQSYLARHIDVPSTHGLHHDVWQCKLPVAQWLGPLVGRNYPAAKGFFNGIAKAAKGEGFWEGNDPRYTQLLNTYGDGLAKYLIADTGMLLQAMADFSSVLDEKSYAGFVIAASRLENKLDEETAYRLRKSRIALPEFNGIVDASDERVREYATRFGLSMDERREFFRHIVHFMRVNDKEAKIAGNYNVHPDELLAFLQIGAEGVTQYCKKNDITPIHVHVPYLYLRGSEEKVRDNAAPWMALEKLPVALVTNKFTGSDAIYYAQNGFYKGLKVIEEPSWHLCPAESQLYAKVLRQVLDQDEAAPETARRGLETLIKQLALHKRPLEDFLFHSKNTDIWWYLGSHAGMGEEGSGKVLCRFGTPADAGFVKEKGVWTSTKKILGKERKVEAAEQNGIFYYDEPYRHGRRDTQWHKTSYGVDKRRVWFLEKGQAHLDVESYATRVRERLLTLIQPIMGEDAKHWLGLSYDRGGLDVFSPLIELPAFHEKTRKQQMLSFE